MFRVFNYNLLSTRLVDPEFHSRCNPDYLKTEYRWDLIEVKLWNETRRKSIICVQELSEDWICLLMPFFHKQKYTFVYDSQFLGVGIAFPSEVYDLNQMSMICVGEELAKLCTPIIKTRITWIEYLLGFFFKQKTEEDIWELAKNKRNRIIGAFLFDKQNKEFFYVFNNHSPCDFFNPPLMTIHGHMLLKIVKEKSEGLPYVLTGDFNSKPDSHVYSMITKNQGYLTTENSPGSKKHSFLPIFHFGISSLVSAYFAKNGRNPAYTNFSHTKRSKVQFMDTIDYIFFTSDKLLCTEVDPIREDFPLSTFPNKEEPSDHLPLGACFQFL